MGDIKSIRFEYISLFQQTLDTFNLTIQTRLLLLGAFEQNNIGVSRLFSLATAAVFCFLCISAGGGEWGDIEKSFVGT